MFLDALIDDAEGSYSMVSPPTFVPWSDARSLKFLCMAFT